jgi:PhnB protein
MTEATSIAAKEAAARGLQPVTPYLTCSGAADAIEFYKRAFDARELVRLPGPDGKVMHACLDINGGSVMLDDEHPQMNNRSPQSLRGTPVTLHLIVDDVDAVIEKATAAGAKVVVPVADMFWGDRYGQIEDPFGHRWSVATPQRRLSEIELREAARAAGLGCNDGN